MFIQENAFEIVVCEISAISSRPQYVNLDNGMDYVITPIGFFEM